jgi:hypothetical protein
VKLPPAVLAIVVAVFVVMSKETPPVVSNELTDGEGAIVVAPMMLVTLDAIAIVELSKNVALVGADVGASVI